MRSSLLAFLSLLAACDAAPSPVSEGSPPAARDELPAAPTAYELAPAESPRLTVDDASLARATEQARAAADEIHAALTTDRPLYRPGETVWARAWQVRTGPLESGGPATDVAVELLDPRGLVVAARRYENRGAGATADLVVPAGAAGGLYSLRASIGGVVTERPLVVAAFEEPRIRKELDLLRDAYAPGDEVTATLVVASSGRGPLADHPVQVVVSVGGEALPPIPARTDADGEATLRFRLPEDLRVADAVLTVLVEEEGWTESVSKPIPVVLDRVAVEAFPEGGSLVQGLPGRVYLRIRDASGQPADARGVVVDGAGREVARFETVHDGLGRFELTPRAGERYSVRVTSPVAAEPVPLPPARTEGCVLRTWDDLDGELAELRAGVWCSTPREVVVAGHLRGHGFVPAAVSAGPEAPAVVYLRPANPDDGRRQGVATVTVWSDDLTPLAERLVYRNRARSLQITLEPTRSHYGPRDEVELRVTTRDPSGEPVPAELALSVVDDRLLKHADDEHGNLLSRLYLEPWVRGTLQDPAWYFDPDEADAGRGLDLVLGTYGWRAFVDRAARAAANPDAGEGARAKREEGKVGKKEAKGNKVDVRHLEIDRAVAENAGVLGALPNGDLDQVLGAPGPSSDLAGGLGGLIGASGTQIGAGGLGGRGGGLGGGGTAEGLGGLGTRGMGTGAAGYGRGGGDFGARGVGGVGIGGEPIVIGALDRARVDEVVRRNLNPIRYCYQRALTKNPGLRGKVVTKFTIAKDGTVPVASTKSTTLHDAAVESCVAGRFRRMQFPQPKGGGIVIVSYPFLFQPGGPNQNDDGGGGTWDPVPPPPLRDTVRVFAQPDYAGKPAPEVRTDFRSTVGWWPDLRTGEDGTATVKFYLADPVTTWRVTAEGLGRGHGGRAEREVHSALPFSLDVPLPTEVSFGDRLTMPIRLSNRRDEATEVVLTTSVQAPLVAEDGTGTQRLRFAPGAGGVTMVPITVPDLVGTATVEVSARSSSLSDAVRRTLTIAPRGFPHRWTGGGSITHRAVHDVPVEDALPGSAEATLRLYPNPLSSLIDGAEAMVRMPHGCFEQTSSTNHPNVLLLEYLDQTGSGAGLAVDRTDILREGYRRLTSYQVEQGGFETFGSGPGKEVLSAYGLLQFTRMRSVFPEVEASVTDRDVAFLLSARDGTGGYTSTGSSSHGYGHAPAAVNEAFITRALVETGHLTSGPEIERQQGQARKSADPYVVALATLTLQRLGDAGATAGARRLVAMQDAAGAFPGATSSVEHSGGQDLLVETTALAALALIRTGADPGAVDRAMVWLGQARQGTAGWGNTQATVLALEAILAASGREAPTPGRIRVVVDGETVRTVQYTGREKGAVTVPMNGWSEGAHRVELVADGDRPIPYTLEATWRRETPADAADAPLHLETTLAGDTVELGRSVRMTASVVNTAVDGVASPIARIRLPAGVRVEEKALEALVEDGRIAFFETRPREVTLYWEGLAKEERRDIPLDLVAEVPGVFTAPPSVVYPYYTSGAVDWEAGPTLRITP